MREVKCKICGRLIPQNEAYKVPIGKRSSYYCSEEEYNGYNAEISRLSCITTMVYDMCGNVPHKTLETEKEIWLQLTDSHTLIGYLSDNRDKILTAMESKSFDNIFRKFKYFSAIIKNSIKEYASQSCTVCVENTVELYKPKSKTILRKGFNELENDDD